MMMWTLVFDTAIWKKTSKIDNLLCLTR